MTYHQRPCSAILESSMRPVGKVSGNDSSAVYNISNLDGSVCLGVMKTIQEMLNLATMSVLDITYHNQLSWNLTETS